MSSSAAGGIRFGQYTLLRRIARGGMAEVFLAQQKGLEGFDRRVAVKRILPHLADAPDFVKMFLGEAKLAAQLTHPNVVHIYDFGKYDGDYFIAMEYVDGVHAGQLYKYAVETEKLPPVLVARLGADAATALHYAHELRGGPGGESKPLGLVHRDVSPANLMVSYDGVVKLCDFGIAKAAALGEQLTNPGQVKGKYAYMSPEQTIAAPLDGRSDVFSLAIVLWELIAGRTIVGRGDAVEAMRAIRDGKLPPIATVAPKTPPALVKALTWAMQTRREARATAMDFAQALEAFIKSSPELATPMQLAGWIRKRFPRDGGGTGQHAAMPGVSIGTRAAPGTLQGTSTPDTPRESGTLVSEGTAAAQDTPPPQLIAASRMRGEDLDSAETAAFTEEDGKETLADDGTIERNAESMIVDEARKSRQRVERRELPAPRGRPATGAPPQRRSPSQEMTSLSSRPTQSSEMTAARVIEPGRRSPSQEMTALAGPPIDVSRTTGTRTTVSAPRDTATDSAPRGAISGITDVTPATPPNLHGGLAALTEVTHRGATPMPMPGSLTEVTPRALPAWRQRRNVVVGAAFGGIVVLSFVIALAAKSCGGGAPPLDAAPVAMRADARVVEPVLSFDASIDAAPIADAASDPTIEMHPLDDAGTGETPTDAREPTIRPDADSVPVLQTSVLEVRTKPAGGVVRVTTIDEARIDPARFALAPGEYSITAEFPGYLPEERDVVMERGVDVVQELVFTRKRPGRAPAATGKLTVRTTPYSVVFHAGKRIGETPFAERELPVGVYVLTFKNPDKPPVTRKVKITANRTTKVSFTFP